MGYTGGTIVVKHGSTLKGGCDMIALLFLLFFVTAGLALRGKKSLALAGAYLSLFLSLLWFFHHASDELPILL